MAKKCGCLRFSMFEICSNYISAHSQNGQKQGGDEWQIVWMVNLV